ncbi:hypothetical protein [Streptomyces sp. FXJ1.172]|uniref:hypothetical protein n=1 Tax=Streptomyces sp. FXJ1.172 TaxID=710705 RepID=UPI0007D0351C
MRTDCDGAIGESWSGSPVTGVPKDNFGVRWSVTRDFGSGGPFTLAVSATDGIRVSMDGYRQIDMWYGTGDTARPANLNLCRCRPADGWSRGPHDEGRPVGTGRPSPSRSPSGQSFSMT